MSKVIEANNRNKRVEKKSDTTVVSPQRPSPAPYVELGERSSLGDYVIIRKIGQGGMGIVYEALQTSLNRRVALKVLPLYLVKDDITVKRFRNEAEAAARIHHPNIAAIYEMGLDKECYYYAMEYIEGRTLDEMLDNDEIEKNEALRVIASVAEALFYAHKQGVVHRDIKPSNIIIDTEGKIVITDFGIAKISNTSKLTNTGTMVGTPTYASPEQILSSRQTSIKIDRRSDVYALGIVLYEMFTGELPFTGETDYEIITKVIECTPKYPRQIDPSISKNLEAIIMKAIEKKPENRYETALEFKEDIERFAKGEPVIAKPITIIEKLFRKSKKYSVSLGIILSAMLISSLIWYYYIWEIGLITRQVSTGMEQNKVERPKEYLGEIGGATVVLTPSLGIEWLREADALHETVLKSEEVDFSLIRTAANKYSAIITGFPSVKLAPGTLLKEEARHKLDSLADYLFNKKLPVLEKELLTEGKYGMAIESYQSLLQAPGLKETLPALTARDRIVKLRRQADEEWEFIDISALKLSSEKQFDKARELYQGVIEDFGIPYIVTNAQERLTDVDDGELREIGSLVATGDYEQAIAAYRALRQKAANPLIIRKAMAEIRTLESRMARAASRQEEEQYRVSMLRVDNAFLNHDFQAATNLCDSIFDEFKRNNTFSHKTLIRKDIIKRLQELKEALTIGINEHPMIKTMLARYNEKLTDTYAIDVITGQAYALIPWNSVSMDKFLSYTKYIDMEEPINKINVGIYSLEIGWIKFTRGELSLQQFDAIKHKALSYFQDVDFDTYEDILCPYLQGKYTDKAITIADLSGWPKDKASSILRYDRNQQLVRLLSDTYSAYEKELILTEYSHRQNSWIELYNAADRRLNLNEYYLGYWKYDIYAQKLKAVHYSRPLSQECDESFINPKAYIMVRPHVSLGSDGGGITLYKKGLRDDSEPTVIDEVFYGNHGGAPVHGNYSHSIIRVPCMENLSSSSKNWTISFKPTPGKPNKGGWFTSLGSSARINELNMDGDIHQIELYNPLPVDVDIQDWFVTDGDHFQRINRNTTKLNGKVISSTLIQPYDVLAFDLELRVSKTDVVYLFTKELERVDQIGCYTDGTMTPRSIQRVPDGTGPNDGYSFLSSGGKEGSMILNGEPSIGSLNTSLP